MHIYINHIILFFFHSHENFCTLIKIKPHFAMNIISFCTSHTDAFNLSTFGDVPYISTPTPLQAFANIWGCSLYLHLHPIASICFFNRLHKNYIKEYMIVYSVNVCVSWIVYLFKIFIHTQIYWGIAVAQWLRCCATNRKVAGSIPAGVWIFHWHKILPIALWPWGWLNL